MARAGKVLFLVDPFQNAGLGPVLERWGLALGNDVIIDINPQGRLAGAGPEVPVVGDYLAHPITRDFRFATFFPVARSVSPKEKAPEGVTAQGLARTSGESWAETNQDQIRTGQVKPDPGEARGPLTIAAVATVDAKDAPAERKDAKARIVLIGDSDFASNGFVNLSGNRDFFLNTLSWLAEEENLIAVRPKEASRPQPVFLTAAQGQVLFLVPVVAHPAGRDRGRRRGGRAPPRTVARSPERCAGRTTAVLAVLLAGLATFYYVYEVRQAPDREKAASVKDHLWKGLEAKDVEEIVVRKGEATLQLKKTGDAWSLAAPVAAPADRRAVEDLATSLATLRVEREIDANPAEARRLRARAAGRGDHLQGQGAGARRQARREEPDRDLGLRAGGRQARGPPGAGGPPAGRAEAAQRLPRPHAPHLRPEGRQDGRACAARRARSSRP